MLRYARKKGGSKSKRKGAKNTGTQVPLWKRCNDLQTAKAGRRGEFRDSPYVRTLANGQEQTRAHVHLPNCSCLSDAAWGKDTGLSADYLAMRDAEKARKRRIAAHEKSRRICSSCRMLLTVSGICPNCV